MHPQSTFLPYRKIPLSGRLGRGKSALVDAEDYPYLSQFRWYWYRPRAGSCPGHEGYTFRTSTGHSGTIYMHREIMHPPDDMEVDHIRVGSGLDNRRSNLRIVTHAVNVRNVGMRRDNKSGHRGVARNKKDRKWRAEIRVNWKLHYLGQYDRIEDAIAAYHAGREALGLGPLSACGCPAQLVPAP